MTVRDDIVNELADRIPEGDAIVIAVRAEIERRYIGGQNPLQLWRSILERLDQKRVPITKLLAAVGADYPATAKACLQRLAAGRESDAEPLQAEPSSQPRRIRVFREDDDKHVRPLASVRIKQSIDVVLVVGPRAPTSAAPQLDLSGLDAAEYSLGTPSVDKSQDWWLVPMKVTPSGSRTRDVAISVPGTSARAGLTLINQRRSTIAAVAFVLLALLCSAVYVVTFRSLASQSWTAVISAVPALTALATVVSWKSPEAFLRGWLRRPRNAVIATVVVAIAMWVPGLALVAIENASPEVVHIGRDLGPGEWVTMMQGSVDRTRYCITAPQRSVGLDALLPREFVKRVAREWVPLGDTFSRSERSTLAVERAHLKGDVAYPIWNDNCEFADPVASIKHGLATVHIPYGWMLSVPPAERDGVLLLEWKFGPRLISETLGLVSTPGGTLTCHVNAERVYLEPVELVGASSVRLVGQRGDSKSAWESAPSAWRCRIDDAISTIDAKLSNDATKLSLPDVSGSFDLHVGKLGPLRVKGASEVVYRRVTWNAPQFDGVFELSPTVRIAIRGELAIVSSDRYPATGRIRLGRETYDVTIDSEVTIDKETARYCFYLDNGGAIRGPCTGNKPASCRDTADQQRLAERGGACRALRLYTCTRAPCGS